MVYTHVCVLVSCKNFCTKVCIRSLQDFHLQSLASNLQDFHLVRYLVQETCKIFILQDNKCKKCARFWFCKITGARNVHDSWLARSLVQETCISCKKCARRCKIFYMGTITLSMTVNSLSNSNLLFPMVDCILHKMSIDITQYHTHLISPLNSTLHTNTRQLHGLVNIYGKYCRLWLLSACAYNARSQRTMHLTKRCAYTGDVHAHDWPRDLFTVQLWGIKY